MTSTTKTTTKDNANPTIVAETTFESRKNSLLYQRLCQNELDIDNKQQQRSQWDITIDEFLGGVNNFNNDKNDITTTKPTVEDYVSYHTLMDVVSNYNTTTNNHHNTNSPVSILQHIGIWDELLPVDNITSTSNNRNVFYNTNSNMKNDILDCINLFSVSNNNNSTMKKKQQQQQQQQQKQTHKNTTTCTTIISCEEIYEIIRTIQDPEHPLTLEQLGVVSLQQVHISYDTTNSITNILINFTPTIPHCSMATLIGLCIRVKLLRSLSSFGNNTKILVTIQSGTHNSEHAINKQLNDKERVYAAIENNHLLSVVNNCIRNSSTA